MFFWWIDPSEAIILALYTIINWSTTVFENEASLVGQTTPLEMLQKLTYLVLKHHHSIQRVDTIRAYTFGVLYFVEYVKCGFAGENFPSSMFPCMVGQPML